MGELAVSAANTVLNQVWTILTQLSQHMHFILEAADAPTALQLLKAAVEVQYTLLLAQYCVLHCVWLCSRLMQQQVASSFLARMHELCGSALQQHAFHCNLSRPRSLRRDLVVYIGH